ncbi:MAG: hypothetical protein Q7T48_08860 [Cellvibrio sp.]|uniref:hypothetical protein n=1 Tax=Cellvibrio sp. TaxID=1965322 RepID=UPI00271BB8E1|nr:hypothetical protein [Cellvibrio sp.]
MTNYIFTINLFTEDPIPSYQVAKYKGKFPEGKLPEGDFTYFCLTSNKMPTEFKSGDTIHFLILGRAVVDCTLYIKPLTEMSAKNGPFKIMPSKDGERPWKIPFVTNESSQLTVEVDYEECEEEGYWEFMISGAFKAALAVDRHGAVTHFGTIEIPFLVDPECVVGRRH